MWGFDDSSDDDVADRKSALASGKVDEKVFADSENAGERAGHAPRRCTDCLCLLIFIAACSGFVLVYTYCMEHGDMRRLYHGYDYLGRLCGVDKDDSGEILGDYLFWCRKPNDFPIGLDLRHPICVPACPSSANETRNCAQFPPVMGDATVLDEHGSFQRSITYNFAELTQYESRVWGARYCMPKDPGLIKQVTDAISSNWASSVMMKVGETFGAWLPILLASILAVILGFAFLVLVLQCTTLLVFLSLIALILGPLVAGGYLIYIGFNGGADNLPGTGDSQWDLIIGFSCIAIGLIFACLACCARRAIQIAIAVLKATCHCMFSMPSLLLEPVLNVIVKYFVLVLLLIGLAWLLSCGEVQKLTFEQVAMTSLPGTDLSGVFRTLHYKEEEVYWIIYYFFMIFWIMEIFTALSQFTISYAVQLWYFTPYIDDSKEDVPSCGILKGMCVGLTYHLGSLSFGAFIIAVFRIVRMLFRIFINSTKGGNPALACIGKCCECCLGCCQKCVEFLNKNAYMDIAITSSNFCTAARRALDIIVTYLGPMMILNGATWVLMLLGMGSITAGCCYLTWLLLQNWPTFSDSASEHYVDDPVLVTIVSGIIALTIARAFMLVFDTVADSIMYCFAIERKRRSCSPPMYPPNIQYAPDDLDNQLKAIVNEHC